MATAEARESIHPPEHVQPESVIVRSAKDVLAGTVAGVGITLVGHPFDTLKVRLQTQSQTNPVYSGLTDCVKQTWRAEGLGGFYKGVASPLVGQMVFNAVQFLAYGQAKRTVCGGVDRELTIPEYFQAGAMTGAFVALVESPIDLFKTQLQVQVFKEKPQFTTFTSTVSHIIRHHGLRGVYQGLAPTMCRNVPAVACYFGAYEYCRRALLEPGQKLEQLSSGKLLAAGSVGGLAYWAFTFPIDVVKSAIQADALVKTDRRFSGIVDATKQLWKEGGIPRFFKGVTPCVLRAAPANATCFFLYQTCINLLG